VKSSKAEIQAKYHKIPVIRFEDQKLTSFSGLLLFQILFRQLRLRERLLWGTYIKKYVRPLKK